MSIKNFTDTLYEIIKTTDYFHSLFYITYYSLGHDTRLKLPKGDPVSVCRNPRSKFLTLVSCSKLSSFRMIDVFCFNSDRSF